MTAVHTKQPRRCYYCNSPMFLDKDGVAYCHSGCASTSANPRHDDDGTCDIDGVSRACDPDTFLD